MVNEPVKTDPGKYLLEAVEKKSDISEIRQILSEHQSSVIYEDESGWTPLAAAATLGLTDTARLLLENGADVNHHSVSVAEPDGWTPLIRAVDSGHCEMVQLLIDHRASINHQDADGWTALFWAVTNQNKNDDNVTLQIIDLLLKRGADVSLKDKTGCTALFYAVQNDHLEILQLLMEQKCSVNESNNAGWTPLHFACQEGYFEIAEYLLSQGADTNAKNSSGTTALMLACERADMKLVRSLFSHGAIKTCNDQANDGWSALFAASKGGYEAIVQLLLARGVDSNHINNFKWSPLFYAVTNGHLGVCQLLVREGHAMANLQDSSGWTALCYAAKMGDVEIGRLLLECGADMSTKTTSEVLYRSQGVERRIGVGWTCLMIGVAENNLEFVKMLISELSSLEKVAEFLKIRNAEQQTAIDLAETSAMKDWLSSF